MHFDDEGGWLPAQHEFPGFVDYAWSLNPTMNAGKLVGEERVGR